MTADADRIAVMELRTYSGLNFKVSHTSASHATTTLITGRLTTSPALCTPRPRQIRREIDGSNYESIQQLDDAVVNILRRTRVTERLQDVLVRLTRHREFELLKCIYEFSSVNNFN